MPGSNPKIIDRRRAIAIIAGGLSLPSTGMAMQIPTATWSGTALGADAKIVLSDADPQRTQRTLKAVLREIERLENVFSLYRPGSAVSILNRNGRLSGAPMELTSLARKALWYTDITGGAFDITVQRIWEHYARHYKMHPDDAVGPPLLAVDALRRFTGPGRIKIDGNEIGLSPGCKVTFNGIAQGYITDRVAALLQENGWRDVLIQLGETRALGPHPDGLPWRIELPGRTRIELDTGALATSSANGTAFGTGKTNHHLFDPHTGRSAKMRRPITVHAPYATDADALSTALFVMPESAHADVLMHVSGASIVQG